MLSIYSHCHKIHLFKYKRFYLNGDFFIIFCNILLKNFYLNKFTKIPFWSRVTCVLCFFRLKSTAYCKCTGIHPSLLNLINLIKIWHKRTCKTIIIFLFVCSEKAVAFLLVYNHIVFIILPLKYVKSITYYVLYTCVHLVYII